MWTSTPAQALVIKPVSKQLGEEAAVKLSSGLLALAFLAMGASSRLWQLMVCLVPLAVGSVMISTLNTARLSKVCGPHTWDETCVSRSCAACASACVIDVLSALLQLLRRVCQTQWQAQ